MASKRRYPQDEDSSSYESDDPSLDNSSSESDWMPDTISSKKTKTKPPQQKARVQHLARDPNSLSSRSSTASGSPALLERIKKCIARGNHPNTPEEEAKTSLRMAAKLMTQHNIRQAEMYAEDGNMNKSQNRGDKSIVAITATKGKKAVGQGFVPNLAQAMQTFFDCMSYSSAHHFSIEWTFYGIPENTVSAAMAFEMTHNLILEWARAKRGVSVTHSYCMGVAEGLLEMARQEKEQEEMEAGSTPEDSEAMDGIQEFDSDGSSLLDINVNLPFWSSQKQLTVFRNTAKQTAEDFVREQNVKLYKKANRSRVRDMEEWKNGKRDSRKIDIRRRRLE
jgi:hypothetical protein